MKKTPSEAETIIKKLKLKELKTITRGYHNYGSLCENERGEKMYLKVRLYPDLVSKDNFAKEVILTKFLSDYFYENPHFLTPRYYRSEISSSPEWLMREYGEGKRMGDTWGFSQKFYELISPEKMSRIFGFLRTAVSEKFSLAKIEKREELFLRQNAKEYEEYFRIYLKFVGKYIDENSAKKALKIFKKNESLLNKNSCLTHNDLHPGNVLVLEKNKIMLHDWKYSQFDNPYLDFAFFWLLSWTNDDWRDGLKEAEENNAKDKNMFRRLFCLSILKLTPKIMSILIQSSAIPKDEFQKGMEKILNDFNKTVEELD